MPLVAGRDPARGWVLDPPSVNGDPIFSDVASYDVTFRAPAGWRVIGTGITTETLKRGSGVDHHFVTGPVRDMTLVLDNDFESVATEVNGTTITSWYEPGQERVGEAVLTYAGSGTSTSGGSRSGSTASSGSARTAADRSAMSATAKGKGKAKHQSGTGKSTGEGHGKALGHAKKS